MAFRVILASALCLVSLIIQPIGPAASPANAQDSLPPAPYAYQQLDNPAQEQAAMELMHSLRCLTCQSQSIADSDAPLAGDMRHQVRTRILAGEEPEVIRAWLVERYGDYVSYDPQISASTWPLFAVPLVLLLLAGIILFKRLGRRESQEHSDPGS